MKMDLGKRYLHNWHLDLLNSKLLDLAMGDVRRLLISLPPRHGKSSLISHYFSSWFLGNNPDKRVILTSYEADFAASWGRKARATLQEYGADVFGIRVSDESAAVNRWDLANHQGGMGTAGAGGAIIGKGADLLIIDDPIKNAEEANSQTVRDRIWEWYQSVAYTRLEPDGRIVIIQSRWNEDDLTGRVLNEMENGGEAWDVISLPALAEKDEYYKGQLVRKAGEALWPARFPEDRLLEIKKAIGNYYWQALYQGRPSPMEGNLFKRGYFKYFQETEREYLLADRVYSKNDVRIFTTVDLATSLSKEASFFCIGVFGLTPQNELLVLEIFRARVEAPEQLNIVKEYYVKWHPFAIYVESVAYQLSFVQQLRRNGLPVKEFRVRDDKVARAISSTALYEGGRIYHRAGAPWLGDFEEELVLFPHGANTDQVDVLSMASLTLANLNLGKKAVRFVKTEKELDWHELLNG